MRRFLRRRWRWVLLSALILIGAGAAFFYAFVLADLPPLSQLQAGMILPSTRFYDRNGTLLFDVSAPEAGRNTVLPYEDFPATCVQAVISTEDANYWSHPGVDPLGILRALWINLRGGEVIAGGSTITQQTVRLLLLTPLKQNDRTLQRKLKEIVLALELQASMSREDVLALYLNQVYLGHLAYGFPAAAQAYFQKDVRELSLAECALLAGMVQNAAAYDPLTRLDAARDRQRTVLELMVQAGAISDQAAKTAAQDNLQFASTPYRIEAPHAVMTALQQIERDYPDALISGGLDVTLTVDLNWTQRAQTIVQRQLDVLNHPPSGQRVAANAHNAALIALDPHTGEILTMLGSPDYFDASIDGALNATLTYRQPGSTLKPFTYALALDPSRPQPDTAATMLLDVQTPFITRRLESYSPGNYGLVEHGPVSLREALASSYNIPAVATLEKVGVPALLELLAQAGIENLAQGGKVDLAVTLGGGEVRLLDLAQAYTIFPNGGSTIAPTLIRRVATRNGQVLYEAPLAVQQPVIDERVAWLITDILSDNNARLPSFGINNALQIGRPAAAKTGTTTDYRDNWVVGYTPDLVVGVWVGNTDNTAMTDVSGISGAGPIWNQFMREVLRGTPVQAFVRPPGLLRQQVCLPSGLLPTPLCQRQRSEWFITGTQPTQPDNLYQRVVLDRRTRQLASPGTPPQDQQAQVFLVLPQEARDWAFQHNIPQPPADFSRRPDEDAPLRLLAPDPYTIFQISQRVPLAAQRLRLTVGTPSNTQQVEYRLNGTSIGRASSSPWVVWWPLVAGDYTLEARALLADGTTLTSDTIPFQVLPPPS